MCKDGKQHVESLRDGRHFYIDGVLELDEVGFLEADWGWDVEVGEKAGDDAHDTVASLEASASVIRV